MRSCILYTWWILMDQATIQRKIIWTPFEAKLDVAGFGNRSMDDRQKVFVWILLCWCSLVCNKNAIEVLCDRSFEIHIVHLVDSEIPGWFPPKNTPTQIFKDLNFRRLEKTTQPLHGDFRFWKPQGDLRFSRRAFGDAHRVPWVENNVVLQGVDRGFPKITGLGVFPFFRG